MKILILKLLCLLILLAFTSVNYSQQRNKMNGITIDGISGLNNIVNSIRAHSVKTTTRIVFDEWQPASGYLNAVNRLDSVTQIMGELLDSYYVNDYSVQQYKDRTDEYLPLLGSKVDIWEIGNEVNGEWIGNRDSVMAKIYYAYYRAEKSGYKTAMTLYYNKNCWENPRHEMFRWVNENVPQKMKQGLDYVFVSYYEDDCNNYQPNWQQVFDSLQVLFPASRLGIGECGTTINSRKVEYINRYYNMNVTTSSFIGGYFWWYYKQDCVPFTTKPLWQVIDNAMRGNTNTEDGDY